MKYNQVKHVIVKDGDKIKGIIGWGDDWTILHTHMIDEKTLGVWIIAGE